MQRQASLAAAARAGQGDKPFRSDHLRYRIDLLYSANKRGGRQRKVIRRGGEGRACMERDGGEGSPIRLHRLVKRDLRDFGRSEAVLRLPGQQPKNKITEWTRHACWQGSRFFILDRKDILL